MNYNENNIRLSKHAEQQCKERGATEEEIKIAILGSDWKEAKNGKFECKYTFQHEAEWNGKYYAFKEVRPIFASEKDEIVVITVFTYYS